MGLRHLGNIPALLTSMPVIICILLYVVCSCGRQWDWTGSCSITVPLAAVSAELRPPVLGSPTLDVLRRCLSRASGSRLTTTTVTDGPQVTCATRACSS